MKRDWNKFGLMEISQIVSTRNFGDYDEEDFEAMIARCNGCSLGGDPLVVKQAHINVESLQRELDRRRADAARRLREADDAERHRQNTALEEKKLGQLTGIKGEVAGIGGEVAGIKGEVAKIGGHVESLDNRVTNMGTRTRRTSPRPFCSSCSSAIRSGGRIAARDGSARICWPG